MRLHAIDTPEKGQIYFLRAKEALFKLISNKSLTLEKINYDKYGRVVGIIYADNENVNYQMIQHGHAWCYRKYNRNPKFIEAEENAKSKKIGLWSLKEKMSHLGSGGKKVQNNENTYSLLVAFLLQYCFNKYHWSKIFTFAPDMFSNGLFGNPITLTTGILLTR